MILATLAVFGVLALAMAVYSGNAQAKKQIKQLHYED
jgi:hypothetical protein